MKKVYISPEAQEIRIDDVITASSLTVEAEGNGLSIDFGDLL